MVTNKHQSTGFTLIEVILYVALLGMLLTGAIMAAFVLADASADNLRKIEIQEEGAYLIQKISWAVTNASSVSVTNGGSMLTVVKKSGPDFSTDDNPIRIYEEENALLMRRSGAEPAPLNMSALAVSDFEAELQGTGESQILFVTFSLEGTEFSLRRYLNDI